jgi:hypothetical protein
MNLPPETCVFNFDYGVQYYLPNGTFIRIVLEPDGTYQTYTGNSGFEPPRICPAYARPLVPGESIQTPKGVPVPGPKALPAPGAQEPPPPSAQEPTVPAPPEPTTPGTEVTPQPIPETPLPPPEAPRGSILDTIEGAIGRALEVTGDVQIYLIIAAEIDRTLKGYVTAVDCCTFLSNLQIRGFGKLVPKFKQLYQDIIKLLQWALRYRELCAKSVPPDCKARLENDIARMNNAARVIQGWLQDCQNGLRIARARDCSSFWMATTTCSIRGSIVSWIIERVKQAQDAAQTVDGWRRELTAFAARCHCRPMDDFEEINPRIKLQPPPTAVNVPPPVGVKVGQVRVMNNFVVAATPPALPAPAQPGPAGAAQACPPGTRITAGLGGLSVKSYCAPILSIVPTDQ